ncbi:MAG: hypothetical protein AAF310_00320 [Myxococcota bacterium]
MRLSWGKCLFVVSGILFSSYGYAQQSDELPSLDSVKWDDDGQDKSKQDDLGFRWSILVGTAPSWSVNHNRLEIEDGYYADLGLDFELGLGYVTKHHEWFADFSIFEKFVLVPSASGFSNSSDMWYFDTIYRYRFLPWMGLFDRVRIRSAVFPTTDNREDPVNYVIADLKDNFIETIEDDNLRLTTAFLPLRLRESAGLFFQPWRLEEFSWDLRAGFGAWMTFAKGQRVVDGVDKASRVIKIDEIDNIYHFGPEVGTTVVGYVLNTVLSYRAGVDVLVPYLRYGIERIAGSAWKLIDMDAFAQLALHPIRWMSFSWNFTAIREASIRPEVQLHNYLMIAFTYANKTKGKSMY